MSLHDASTHVWKVAAIDGFSTNVIESITEAGNSICGGWDDQDGDLLDIPVQPHKEAKAARRFFRKLLKGLGQLPFDTTTDKRDSWCAAKREVMLSVLRCQACYAKDRARYPTSTSATVSGRCENSLVVATRSAILSVDGRCHNLFRVGRHLLGAQLSVAVLEVISDLAADYVRLINEICVEVRTRRGGPVVT